MPRTIAMDDWQRQLELNPPVRDGNPEAQLAPTRFHDLRHTAAASLMLANNEHRRVAAAMLGHADVGITVNLYTHSTPTLVREAAERKAGLIGGLTVE